MNERFIILMSDQHPFDSNSVSMERVIKRMADVRADVLSYLERHGYRASQAAYVEALVHAHLCAGSLPAPPSGEPVEAVSNDDSYHGMGWVA
jgi:hypothetical protein